MNLKESYGSRVWRDAALVDIIRSQLDGCDTHDELHMTISEILANVITKVAHTDAEKLDIVGGYRWEIDNRTDEELFRG